MQENKKTKNRQMIKKSQRMKTETRSPAREASF